MSCSRTKQRLNLVSLQRKSTFPTVGPKMDTILTVLCIVLLSCSALAANVGDTCQVARSGAQGICKLITECQPAIDDIVKQSLYPAQCGFRGRDQIVCCAVPVTHTTTTTPAPTRVSQRSR